jgi:hypothetical protein
MTPAKKGKCAYIQSLTLLLILGHAQTDGHMQLTYKVICFIMRTKCMYSSFPLKGTFRVTDNRKIALKKRLMQSNFYNTNT